MSTQATDAFAEAARSIFSTWTALNLAIDNQWGGPQSREKGLEMLDYTIRLFRGGNRVYGDELEDYYENYFGEQFNTEAGDGSSRQVADLLIEVHKECMLGNLDRVRQLIGAPVVSSVTQSRRENESDDDVSGGEEDDEMSDVAQPPPPQQAPAAPRHVVDEDGFEVVTRKGRR